jgi:hypothetical protein
MPKSGRQGAPYDVKRLLAADVFVSVCNLLLCPFQYFPNVCKELKVIGVVGRITFK